MCYTPIQVYSSRTLHPDICPQSSHRSLKPVVTVPNSQRSLNTSISQSSSSQMRTTQVFLSWVFSPPFFLEKHKCCFAYSWEVEDSKDLGTTVFMKSYHHLGLSPTRPNELWCCLDHGAARAQAPGPTVNDINNIGLIKKATHTVPAVLGELAVWRHTKKNIIVTAHHLCALML